MRRLFAVPLLCALLAVPALAAVTNRDSPFGVICSWPGIRDAGVKWVRCGAGCSALDWGAVEKERGVYNWKNADAEVNGWTKDEGVELLVIFGYTPKWASSGPNGENSAPPRDLKDWTNFVHTVVSRYKGKVKYWEVWNEPDIGFWTGTIEQYCDLLKSAYVAAKKADPECKVVFGGLAGVNLPFLERVYQYGGGPFFDVMAVHPYQWGDTFNDEWFSLQLRNLRDLMVKYRERYKEVWLTELGWSTGDAGITEDVQARLLQQAMIAGLSLSDIDVTKVFWFSVKDWGGPGYGLIRPDGARKPAFEAYRFVTGVLEGSQYLGPIEHQALRCHRFRGKDGKLLLAAWHPGKEKAPLELPAGKRWVEAKRFGGPVQIEGGAVEVGPDPVFVLSADEVPDPTPMSRPDYDDRSKRDVWLGIAPPEGTSRLYVIRGVHQVLTFKAHNDSGRGAFVRLEARINGREGSCRPVYLADGEVGDVTVKFLLPADFEAGTAELLVQGTVQSEQLPWMRIPVRVSDGPVIEFLANSTVESRYLVENEGSGCAPSVRFSGTWIYKFDLSKAKSASLELDVGAHEANEWQVLASSDQVAWKTVLSGKSNRSRHEVDVSAWAGGPLYIKFAGNGQQLGELALSVGL